MHTKEQVELKNKTMKKFNWGILFEWIGYIGFASIGIGILSWAFIFIWQIIKSIF